MYTNRESWLLAAAVELTPLLSLAGLKIPASLKVSCGFPGKGSRKKRIGECWVSAKQVFVSPLLSNTNEVLETLAHELIHACLEVGVKHGKPFKDAMKAVGLEGKATVTVAGAALLEKFKPINKTLGPYPHKALVLEEREKGQTTRLLKVQCPACGYIARVTRKVLDEHGPPVCPTDKVSFIEEEIKDGE